MNRSRMNMNRVGWVGYFHGTNVGFDVMLTVQIPVIKKLCWNNYNELLNIQQMLSPLSVLIKIILLFNVSKLLHHPVSWEAHYLQNLLFNIIYSRGGGLWGWKMAWLYNQQGVSRVIQHYYNALHPLWFRSYKQTTKAKTNGQSALFIVIYGRQGINWSPLSLSLIRKAGARKRHITSSSVTHTLVYRSLALTDMHIQTQQNEYIQNILYTDPRLLKHTHPSINNHRDLDQLSLHINGHIQLTYLMPKDLKIQEALWCYLKSSHYLYCYKAICGRYMYLWSMIVLWDGQHTQVVLCVLNWVFLLQ